MKSPSIVRSGIATAVIGTLSAGLVSQMYAETIATAPVGAVTYTVPANATRAITVPLLDQATGVGQISGVITSVTTNKISNSNAGWSAGSFSNAAYPFYVRITSGQAEGRLFLISTATPNSTTELTVNNDGTDITTLGIAANVDHYEIVPADTLSSLFGSDTLQGGTSASVADNVYVWNTSSYLKFYYNTTRNRWERDSDTAASPSRDTFVLRPDRGIMIQRNASTSLVFTVTGRVQANAFSVVHNTNGTSFLNYGFPMAVTLNSLGVHNLAGWKTWNDPLTAAANADLVQVWNSSSWLTFYYDSDNNRWQRVAEVAETNRNTYSIAACVPIVVKRTTNNSSKVVSFARPY